MEVVIIIVQAQTVVAWNFFSKHFLPFPRQLGQTLPSKPRWRAHRFTSPLPAAPAANGVDGIPVPSLQLVVYVMVLVLGGAATYWLLHIYSRIE